MIYFVTVNYYSTEQIARLLQSIKNTTNIPYQFIVINNSPEDAAIYDLAGDETLIIDAGENLGFGGGCNLGIDWVYKQDPQGIVWLINPDTVIKDTPDGAVAFFDSYPEVSILGTTVWEPTGKLWFGGGQFLAATGAILEKNLLSENRLTAAYVPCDWVTGCSLLINLRNFQNCPRFDCQYFLYYEDFDFCRRYDREGHLIAVTDRLAVIHYPSSIINRDLYQKYNHSTYSYLLTMQRYASQWVLGWRFARLLGNALLLLLTKPAVARGKLDGLFRYMKSF
ncbi:MAG: glycosyltransferase family 2 protein [Oscillatoria sp. SIO1A7]|nr:glycosyltransferase family 2 protein [Oscillatoria sp. SIO1A7]